MSEGQDMDVSGLLKYAELLQVVLSVLAISAMIYRKLLTDFLAVAVTLFVVALSSSTTVAILYYRTCLHLSRAAAFHAYLLVDWSTSFAEFILQILIIYGLFSSAMRPFPGLHRIGKIVFRWVGSVSFLVALALAAGPQIFERGLTATQISAQIDGRLQQGVGVLILCLLIFVSFSVRPLGLTYRSHIFGVVLGLSIVATVQLVEAACLATTGTNSVYSPISLFSSLGGSVAFAVWLVYFALPEPKRRMILLPTTSPFFHWNRISEILGDAPGHVAVAGFSPDMLAPAEIAVLTAATSREAASAAASATDAAFFAPMSPLATLPKPVLAEFADPAFGTLAPTR